jgi:hypothetical protein
MTQVATHQTFPYGTFPVASSVLDLYQKAPLSHICPLPDALPMHHPVLQHLEGIYPMADTLPPWWAEWASMSTPALKPLLQAVTKREFREGVVDQQRWRSWKTSMPPQEQEVLQTTSIGKRLMQSPKLIPTFMESYQKEWFEERGPRDTPEDLDLIVSFRPEHLLNMSNGHGWTSCQHLYEGSCNECLPANCYDTGVAVALVVPRGADIWQGADRTRNGVVLARTTLRVFFEHDTPVVVICRPYDNNKTVLSLLLSRLVTLFQDHGLSWGTIGYYALTDLLQSGFIGNYQRVRREEERELCSPAFWMPPHFDQPYVDGAFDWGSTDTGFTELSARIHRWRL